MIGTTPNSRLEQLRERLASFDSIRELAFDTQDEATLSTIEQLIESAQQAEQALAEYLNEQHRISNQQSAIEKQGRKAASALDLQDTQLDEKQAQLAKLDAEKNRLLKQRKKVRRDIHFVNQMLDDIRKDEQSLTSILSPLIGEFGETFSELIASLAKELDQGLTDFIQQAKEVFADEIKVLEAFEQNMAQQIEAFSEFAQAEFDSFINSLDEQTQQEIAAFLQVADNAIKDSYDALQAVKQELSDLADDIKEAVIEFTDEAHQVIDPESFLLDQIQEAAQKSAQARTDAIALAEQAKILDVTLIAKTNTQTMRQAELDHLTQQSSQITADLAALKQKEGNIPIVKNIRSYFNRAQKAEYKKQLAELKPQIRIQTEALEAVTQEVKAITEQKEQINTNKAAQEKKQKNHEKKQKKLELKLKDLNPTLAKKNQLLAKMRLAQDQLQEQQAAKVHGTLAIAKDHLAHKVASHYDIKPTKDDKKALRRARKNFTEQLDHLSTQIETNIESRKELKKQIKKDNRQFDKALSEGEHMIARHQKLQKQLDTLERTIEQRHRQLDALYRKIDVLTNELDERIESRIEHAFDASWDMPIEDTLDQELIHYFQSKYSADTRAHHSMHTSLEGLDAAMLALIEQGKEDEVIQCLFILHDMAQVPELSDIDLDAALDEANSFRSNLAKVVTALPEKFDFDFEDLFDEDEEAEASFEFDLGDDEDDDLSTTLSQDELFQQALAHYSQNKQQSDRPMVQSILDAMHQAATNYQHSMQSPGSVFQSYGLHQNQYVICKRELLKSFILESHALLESLDENYHFPTDLLSEYKKTLEALHQESCKLDIEAGKPKDSSHPLNSAIEKVVQSLSLDTQKSKQTLK